MAGQERGSNYYKARAPVTPALQSLCSSLDRYTPSIKRHFIMSPSVIVVSRNEDFLDEHDVEALADLEENDSRIMLMLEMLRTRGYEAYRKFIIVLRKTGHNFLADQLDPEPGTEPKKVSFNSIPEVYEVTSTSTSSSSSSSTETSSSDSEDERRHRRRKKKKKKERQQRIKSYPKNHQNPDGVLNDIPDLNLPKLSVSQTPRVSAEQGAGKAIDRLYLHYDNSKVNHRRKLDGLRYEERQLRSSLVINKNEQHTCRHNLSTINTIKRQIAFVNDKESLIKNSHIDVEEKIKELENPMPGDGDTWTTMRGRELALPPDSTWKANRHRHSFMF